MSLSRSCVVHAAGLVLLVSACTSTPSDRSESAEVAFVTGGTFTTAISTPPGDLDPHGAGRFTNFRVVSYAYDSLINLTPDAEVVSGLATDWEVTPTSVRFTIGEEVTCTDGTPLEPSDIKANFDYISDPDNESSLLGSGLFDREFEATADDTAGTLTITTAEPYGFLLTAAGGVAIVCPAGLEDRSLLARSTDGTGPFVLTEVVPNEQFTFEVRDDYTWGPDGATTDIPGLPDTVVLRVVENVTTAANLLVSGELTAVEAREADRERLEGLGFTEYQVPLWNLLMMFNEAPGLPGADPAVRTALTMAVDRGDFAGVVSGGVDEPATTLLSAQPAVCDDSDAAASIPGYDPTAAAELLDDAGWTVGPDGVRSKDGQDLRLDGLAGADEPAGAEFIAQAWGDIGVRVDFSFNNDVAENEILFNTGDWEVGPMIKLVEASQTNLTGVLSGPGPPDGINFPHIDNPDYERFAAEALSTPAEAGCELWTDAARALYERADVIPMAALTTGVFADHAQMEFDRFGLVIPTSIRLVQED